MCTCAHTHSHAHGQPYIQPKQKENKLVSKAPLFSLQGQIFT